MRDSPVHRAPVLCVCVLLACLLSACDHRNADGSAPGGQAVAVRVEVAVATGVAEPLAPLLDIYNQRHPDRMILSRVGGSRAFAREIDTGAPVDLFIAAHSEALAAIAKQPVSQRTWMTDPLVIISRVADNAGMQDFIDDDGVLAIGDEMRSLGLYTRLALRRLDLWMDVSPRTRQFADAFVVMDQVRAGNARFGIVHGVHVARHSDSLRVVQQLDLPDSVEASYVLIAYTPQGEELARWLAGVEAMTMAAQQGLIATPASPGAGG